MYANDIHQLYDVTQKLTYVKQTNHDMSTYLSKVQDVIEELKMILQVDTLQGNLEKLDNLYMVMILQGVHQDYEQVRDQNLTTMDILTMKNLIT